MKVIICVFALVAASHAGFLGKTLGGDYGGHKVGYNNGHVANDVDNHHSVDHVIKVIRENSGFDHGSGYAGSDVKVIKVLGGGNHGGYSGESAVYHGEHDEHGHDHQGAAKVVKIIHGGHDAGNLADHHIENIAHQSSGQIIKVITENTGFNHGSGYAGSDVKVIKVLSGGKHGGYSDGSAVYHGEHDDYGYGHEGAAKVVKIIHGDHDGSAGNMADHHIENIAHQSDGHVIKVLSENTGFDNGSDAGRGDEYNGGVVKVIKVLSSGDHDVHEHGHEAADHHHHQNVGEVKIIKVLQTGGNGW